MGRNKLVPLVPDMVITHSSEEAVNDHSAVIAQNRSDAPGSQMVLVNALPRVQCKTDVSPW